jgi:hypothetical protein
MSEMTLENKELSKRDEKMINRWAAILTGILAIVLFFLILYPQ